MEARDFRQELVELNSQFIDSTDPNVDFLDKYGYNKQEIDAFACTSKSQAYRLGKWFLYTSHRETEVCSFSTDVAAGIIVRPGDRTCCCWPCHFWINADADQAGSK
jgi:predicted phage tail protein